MNKQKRYSFGCISREESFRVYGTQILKRLAGNRLEPVSVAAPRDKVRQHPVLVVEKRLGRINLGHHTLFHDNNAVGVHDGVKAVRDGQNRAVRKGRPDCRLDFVVGFQVNGGSSFVQHEYARLPQ